MSSDAGFPIKDLFRRRLQTGLTTTTLSLSVASTLFLLLFSGHIGVGISSATGTFTLGLSTIFDQFILFMGILIFIVGAVLTSFTVYLMMAQRTRDFSLIKAAGCPNSLVAGYFMTELLTVTFLGCILGVAFGFLADFATAEVLFGGYLSPNWWFTPIVFVAFFILSLFFGLQPLLKASKTSPIRGLSQLNYYGLKISSDKYTALTRSALTWRVASRSLFRRQSTTIRIVVLLSVVFILLTVSVAGGIIARDTTTSWVDQGVDGDTLVIAHKDMGKQYTLLLSKFSGTLETSNFNYTDPKFTIPDIVIGQLNELPSLGSIDSRLVLYGHVQEISNFTIAPDSLQTLPVGDSREGDSVIIGLDPMRIENQMSIKGRFLNSNGTLEAVIGDSISQSMYYPHPSRYVVLSDPLIQSIRFQNTTFHIVGVCVDPLNNGLVIYVPIDNLMNTTGIDSPNLLFVKLKDPIDRDAVISEVKRVIQVVNQDFDAFDLRGVTEQNTLFLASTWQTIMLLPVLSLTSGAMCLVGYMMLAVDEQRQEFGILRAIGAKPRIIIKISAIQSAIVLFSSFGLGISIGIIITVLILMANPLITSTTVAIISIWLFLALISMFLLSLYPAYKLTKTTVLKILT